jgi:hypothetical protein
MLMLLATASSGLGMLRNLRWPFTQFVDIHYAADWALCGVHHPAATGGRCGNPACPTRTPLFAHLPKLGNYTAGVDKNPFIHISVACALQRLGRENAALLERAGIDDLGDLTTKDLNLQTMQQQQLPDAAGSTAAAVATPDVPSTEIAVEALSVQDQQQQQEEDEEELPEDMRDFAEMLEGVVDWGNKQGKMAAALNKLGTWRVDHMHCAGDGCMLCSCVAVRLHDVCVGVCRVYCPAAYLY